MILFQGRIELLMKPLNLLQTLFSKLMVRIIYDVCCLFFPVRKKKVTFASYRSRNLNGNLLYLYNEVNKQYPNYIKVCLLKKYNATKLGKISYLFHMFISSYHLATSSYFFIDDYYFPVYVIKPRKKTTIIQVWHGAGAFKKFGYSTIGKSFGPSIDYLKYVKIHSNYSVVIVSSSEVIPYFSEAFNISPKRIFPLGLPRTDFLLQEKKHVDIKKRLYELHPNLLGKKIILYAPTFRGKSHYQSNFQNYLDFFELKLSLGEKYALIVKLHPYIKTKLKIDEHLRDFVYQIDHQFDTEEILVISDILITDYSSIIFDYSLLGRPIAFYANDLEEYRSERGFYYDYETFIPGPIFNNTRNLAFWIKNGEFNINKIKKFSKRFFNFLDGEASKRIIDAIFQHELDYGFIKQPDGNNQSKQIKFTSNIK